MEINRKEENYLPNEFLPSRFSNADNDPKNYIPHGDDDSYYNVVLNMIRYSPTLSACLNDIINFVYNKGFTCSSDVEKNQDVRKMLDVANNYNQSMNNILNKAIREYLFTGNCYLELVKVKSDDVTQFYCYAHSQKYCRLADTKCHGVANYCVIKSNISDKFNKVLPLYNSDPLFQWAKDVDEENAETNNGTDTERCMLHIAQDSLGYEYYGVPTFVVSALNIMLEHEIVHNNLDTFENGMVLSGVYHVQGNIDQRDANRLQERLINTYTGKGKGSRVLLMANEKITDAKFIPIQNTNKEGNYIELLRTCQETICMTCGWNLELLGIQSSSGIGNTDKLKQIVAEKIEKIVKPLQEQFLSLFRIVFKEYAKFKNLKALVSIENQIKLPAPPNIYFLSGVDPKSIFSVDELRAYAGEPAFHDPEIGKKIVLSVSNKTNDVSTTN